MGKRTWGTVFAMLAAALAAVLVLGGCSGTPHPRNITLTLIRHAESESNAAGIIDTSVPGPGLTDKGRVQAQEIANQLSRNHYDGVYASSMLRAQQTAAPLARELGRQVQVLPGLREISAAAGSATSPGPWWTRRICWLRWPGFTVSGPRPSPARSTATSSTTSSAPRSADLRQQSDANPVAFAHGASIMTWTLMNVKNPRDELLTDHPLPNLGKVVITGNPATGWKLVDWDGIRAF